MFDDFIDAVLPEQLFFLDRNGQHRWARSTALEFSL